ncbi:MAG: hypothetical protein H0W14_07795 [Actinobacteria bacterium]|nr:hypothetical protein [Actinomycetota bacterium]
MTRRMNTERFVVLFAGLAGGLLLAIPAGRSAEATIGPATIRITDQEVSSRRIDIGLRGRSPGDMQIMRHLLFNQRLSDRSIGHVEVVCTFIVGNSRSCRGTYFLPKGKLVVGGSLIYPQFYELAVLGGTGLYDNARGSLTVTRTARSPNRSIVLFRLVG